MKEKLMRITRHEEFETAHLLPGYNGGCGNLHGHSYKIEVTVEGTQNIAFDMVMDFKDLKQAIKEVVPDHRFVYADGDKISEEIAKVLDLYNIQYVRYPFYTTAENMVGYFAELIDNYIKGELNYPEVNVVEVKLWETTNSYATWRREEN